MKRKNNLYDKMISYRNINYIYHKIRINSQNKNKIFSFDKYKNCYLIDILERLKNGTYNFDKYHVFLIHEKKYRIIMSENISDKIVNQLISYFILLPSFNNLIDSNIATRKGKGSKYGYYLFEKYVRSIGLNNNIFVLRIDIQKYFYNIDHEILFNMIKKRIKDKKALKIIKDIIELTDKEYINCDINNLIENEIKRIKKLNISEKEKNIKINELNSIPIYKKGKGLSIGCLSNQLLAVFYLNELDHYIKEELKCKYYIRYMDDIYILNSDNSYLRECFNKIKNYLYNIKLDVNNKSNIYSLNEGVSFLGYTYTKRSNKLLIRYDNSTIKRIRKKLNKLYQTNFNNYFSSISSYKGYFVRCNTNLYYKEYKRLCFENRYDKYIIVKNRYQNKIVFIKYKNKYYTYSNDLIIIRNYFNKNIRYLYQKELLNFNNYILLEGNAIK